MFGNVTKENVSIHCYLFSHGNNNSFKMSLCCPQQRSFSGVLFVGAFVVSARYSPARWTFPRVLLSLNRGLGRIELVSRV